MPEYQLALYRGKWCAYWREHDKPCRRSLGTVDRKEAERALAVFRAAQTQQAVTVELLWNRHREALGKRPVATTMVHAWKFLRDRFGHLEPSSITDALVQDHIDMRRKSGRSDGTTWTELGYLRTALNRGVKDGLIARAPRIIRPPQPAPRELYLTRLQFEKFLAACQLPHIRLFVTLAMTTGARSAALLQLKWLRVDFERGLIKLKGDVIGPRQKGRATVPMNESARQALQEARQGAISEYVVEWAGDRIGSVKRAMRAAGKRSGLTWVTPHVFRHSAAVWMAEAGRSMSEIAQYLGHSDSRVTERVYAEILTGSFERGSERARDRRDRLMVGDVGIEPTTYRM